jgi:hypothetical protein
MVTLPRSAGPRALDLSALAPLTEGQVFMTFGRLTLAADKEQTVGMEQYVLTLAQLLSMAALLGVTIEYMETLKRRVEARRAAAEREEQGDVGLRGLVRLLLVDKPR